MEPLLYKVHSAMAQLDGSRETLAPGVVLFSYSSG